MAHKYCKSCGSKNQYVGAEPKFCSHCGAPLGLSQKHISKGSIAQKEISRELNEDETNFDYVPQITRLQYEVSPFEKKTFKVEELFNIKNDQEEKG